MPLDFEASEVSQSTDFTIRTRDQVQGEQQANETYKVTAKPDCRPLGRNGELNGIAKREFRAVYRDATELRNQARQQGVQRLEEIKRELETRLGAEGLQEEERQRLQVQQRFLRSKQNLDELGANYAESLPDYANEPKLKGYFAACARHDGLKDGLYASEVLFAERLLDDAGIPGNLDNLNFLTRAVASSQVDRLLGTNILSEEKFGLDERGEPVSISVEADGIGVIGDLPSGKEYFLDLDYSRPETQRGLFDLEALDYITGQMDRHPGNIFIDPATGKVTGIDNDFAFPDQSRDELLKNRPDVRQKAVDNPPLFMHADTARRIESMRPADLRRALGGVRLPGAENRGGLSPEEIEGAVQRLKDLQTHIRQMRKEGRVVKAFNDDTYYRAATDQMESYRKEISSKEGRDYQNNSNLSTATKANIVGQCSKTSYVGSIAVSSRRNRIGVDKNESERVSPERYRELRNTTGIAARSTEQDNYARLLQERRQSLRQDAETRHQGERRKLEQKLEKCDRKVEADKPGLMDRFKSAFRRGVHGGMESLMKDRQDVLFKLRDLDNKIDREVDRALDDRTKQGLFQNALEETRLQVPLTNPLGPQGPNVREALQQNRRPQQGEYVNFGEVLEEAKQRQEQQTGVNQSGEYVDFGPVLEEAKQRQGQQAGVNQSGEYVDFGEVLEAAEQKRIGKPSVRDSLPKPSQDPNANIGPGIGKQQPH